MVVPSLILLVGLLLGWFAGRAYQRAAGGWYDYRTQRSKVSLLRSAAFTLTGRAATVVFVVVVLAVIAVCVAASGIR